MSISLGLGCLWPGDNWLKEAPRKSMLDPGNRVRNACYKPHHTWHTEADITHNGCRLSVWWCSQGGRGFCGVVSSFWRHPGCCALLVDALAERTRRQPPFGRKRARGQLIENQWVNF